MNITEFNALRRNYRRTMDAILSPKFDMTPEFLRELLTQHALDLEKWMRDEWAKIHRLEVAGEWACLYELVPGERCTARVQSVGDECPGCFHKTYLQNVTLFRWAEEEHASVLLAQATIAPAEYGSVVQQAKEDAKELGLEVYIQDDLLSWRRYGRTVQFVCVHPRGTAR